MVFKKSSTLLVATKTIPFFVIVPIIYDHRCSWILTQIGVIIIRNLRMLLPLRLFIFLAPYYCPLNTVP